jgi:hypothetical protein
VTEMTGRRVARLLATRVGDAHAASEPGRLGGVAP